ncbi:glucose-1-phosphate adenylyltransferase [Mariprofundus sp. EBB-1]|uniref:glucose-1-phosphate adenylyltransferase n=1 Tax=Mariprofundus sp. EBB-1 TaxID=2650971 RepID=UPI001914568F|nr:glucose-1-phosphate adenylyltransferase [Mariprofundus sp. EBB-1]
MLAGSIMKNTMAIVLAGGTGSRLAPLTQHRAKPAVHFGGKYRIIDFTLSNCLHSDIRRILVLTQYRSHSMHKHLRNGWNILTPEMGEYITAIPAQMKHGNHWYEGTADAVYQNIDLLRWNSAKYIIILSGDHIYRMDYAAMLKDHIEQDAEVSIACKRVPRQQASEFGVVDVDEKLNISAFTEKPEHPTSVPDDPTQSLISMGIYIFNKKNLIERLEADRDVANSKHDFGHDIIPAWIEHGHVNAYLFDNVMGRVSSDNYWRDVGTLDAYFEANMDLLKNVPPLNLHQSDWAIRTYNAQHPPCRTGPSDTGINELLNNVIMCSGSLIIGATIKDSILAAEVQVEAGAIIESSIIFSDVHIAEGVKLRRCIVDKHVRIPAGEQIGFNRQRDSARFTVTESGITVIPAGYRFT